MTLLRILCLACIASSVLLFSRPLAAQPKSIEGTVVLAPVSSLGASNAKALLSLQSLIETGLGTLPNIKVIPARSASKSAKRAKRPELRTCEGDSLCLSELGVLVSAQYTVYAEVGGLGDAQVIYMKLIEVANKTELRSTTLQLSGDKDSQALGNAAATRLLAPELYTGTLEIVTLVPGATVFLDGHKITQTPGQPLKVYVGTHALRVTHPEHRDYVRFVDIEFGGTTKVEPELKRLPGLNRKLSREGIIEDPNARPTLYEQKDRPWYYRWYAITGGVTAVALTSAIVFASASGGIDADLIKKLK